MLPDNILARAQVSNGTSGATNVLLKWIDPMNCRSLTILAYLLLAAAAPRPACAQNADVPLYGDTAIRFATREEALAVLTARDAFANELSKFDLQCRLQTAEEVTLDDWARHVSREVLQWDKAEIERLTAVIGRVREGLAKFRLPLPKTILLIRTTGKEEADAAYTRANAIVLPTEALERAPVQLDSLLLHELFHVLSRHDKDVRRELYKIIGFELCEPIALPPSLADRKLTNPDAPAIDCYIELVVEGKKLTAAPILYASAKQFDPQQGGNLFRYLTFRLLVIEQKEGKWQSVYHGDQPTVIDPKKLPAYFEKIGKNTGYIIHPDEILADNFMFLVAGQNKVETPRILEDMGRVLAR